MAFTIPEQINKLLEDKKKVLIVFRKDATSDAITSALALFLFLKKIDKPADIICEDFRLSDKLRFLKSADEIQSGFSCLKKFVITLDIDKTGIKELSYDLKNKKLRIFVTPKQGYLDKEHIKTAQSDFKYDLIFTINTPDLISLGSIY